MAGLDRNAPLPTRIVLHKQSRVLELEFNDGRQFRLPAELLRVYSPSAEVRGHGPGQEVLQTGKRDVAIDAIDGVGHYALQPRFSDGHESGLFSWDYLYWLGDQQTRLWADYEARLAQAGASRDPAPQVVMRSGERATDGAGSGGAARAGAAAAKGGEDAAATLRATALSRPK